MDIIICLIVIVAVVFVMWRAERYAEALDARNDLRATEERERRLFAKMLEAERKRQEANRAWLRRGL